MYLFLFSLLKLCIFNCELLENYGCLDTFIEKRSIPRGHSVVPEHTIYDKRGCTGRRATRDAGRLERMVVINQLPRWAQLARRRGGPREREKKLLRDRDFGRPASSSLLLRPPTLSFSVRSVFSAAS